jgi:hypothetical protein
VEVAVDREHGSGDRRGVGRGEVDDRGGHLLGRDEAPDRLTRLRRRRRGVGIVGGGEEAPHPRRVRRPGVDAVDADAVREMVGGHREGEGLHSTLAGAVERSARQPGGRRDRADVRRSPPPPMRADAGGRPA